MKKITILLVLFTCSGFAFSQSAQEWGFNSVFQKLATGKFGGTVSGLVIVKNNASEVLLDFQGSPATLVMETDSDYIYDVSTKVYSGKTSSGKTEVKYATYANANELGLFMYGNWFEITKIDGAADERIDGITFTYKLEKEYEYLILEITKELTLDNLQYLLRTTEDRSDIEAKTKSIKVMPHSVLVFNIKRNMN